MRAILLLLLLASTSVSAQTTAFNPTRCELTFSPNRGATAAVVQLIDLAKREVYVMMYVYTSPQVSEALRRAIRERKVRVFMVVDKLAPTANGSQVPGDKAAGAEIYVDTVHRTMHDKVIVVDATYFMTGSLNFTVSAEKVNAENVVICKSTTAAKALIEEWNRLKAQSRPY